MVFVKRNKLRHYKNKLEDREKEKGGKNSIGRQGTLRSVNTGLWCRS